MGRGKFTNCRGLLLAACFLATQCGGTGADSTSEATGTPVKVNIVMADPNGSGAVSKDLESGSVSKAIAMSPDSCTLTVSASDITTITKTFTYADPATVEVEIPTGTGRTISVACTDSSLADNSITVGFEGSTTATISSGTTTVSMTPQFRNILNDTANSSGLASCRVLQSSGTVTTVHANFESTLTDAERVATRCTFEFETAGTATSRSAIDVTTSDCAAASSPGNPSLRFVGGTTAPTCHLYNSSGSQIMKGTGTWTTDSSGNTRAACTFGVVQTTDLLDSNETGQVACSCRISSSGDCDAVPSTGFGVYNLSTNSNSDTTSLAANGSACTISNSGRDCNGGWCILADTSTGALCTSLSANSNGASVGAVGGTGTAGSTTGTISSAQFSSPSDCVLTPSGDNIFCSDTGNHQVRRINLTEDTGSVSYITRFAGRTSGAGSGDGSCAAVVGGQFSSPRGITIDSGASNLYVGDSGNHNIRQVAIGSGISCDSITTIAGTGSSGSSNGTGTAASFNGPRGIVIDSSDTNLYIVDTDNHGIRKMVVSSTVVTTLAGNLGTSGSSDGTGTSATFSSPRYCTIDSTDTYLYCGDSGNDLIRRITLSSGEVTALTISGWTPGTISGIAIDPTDTVLYVSDQGFVDTIRSVTLSGTTGTLATVLDSSASLDNSEGIFLSHRGTRIYVVDTADHEIISSD